MAASESRGFGEEEVKRADEFSGEAVTHGRAAWAVGRPGKDLLV
jgi:hypothetical protein